MLALSIAANVALLLVVLLRPKTSPGPRIRATTVGASTPAPPPVMTLVRESAAASVRKSRENSLPLDPPQALTTAMPVAEEIPAEAPETPAIDPRPTLENFPREKTDQLQRIASDYRELSEQVYARTDGIIPPEERQKLSVLEQEKAADLATVLTPPELEEYQLRASDSDRLKRR
jgi:hypothetical protein